MDSLKPYKNILIGGSILLLVFGGYMLLRDRGASLDSSLVASDPLASPGAVLSPQGAAAGQQIISILNELKQIRLDKDVFENPVFKSLIDYTIATTSEEKGRSDPFAPLPFELKEKTEKK